MKQKPSNRKMEQKSKVHNSKIRTTDDLELLKIILEENTHLKAEVLRILAQALGKNAPNK